MNQLKGVPHWCKQWTFLENEDIFPYLQEKYKANFSGFRKALNFYNGHGTDDDTLHVDMFVNKTMEKLLKP